MKENEILERKYGEDSVYFNKERDCYVAQFNKTIDGIHFRPSATGDTPEEAIKSLSAKKRKMLQEKGLEKKTRLTFGRELDQMMRTIRGTVEDKTFNEYEYRVALLKEISFYNRKMGSIDKATIQQGINELCEEMDLAESVCAKLIAFIKRCYEFSTENRHITHNPVAKKHSIKMPVCAKDEEPVLPLESNELNALIQMFEYITSIRPLVAQLRLLGLGINEIIALQWPDVGSKAIVVRRALRRKRHSEMYRGEQKHWYSWEIGDSPKPRTVLLDTELCEALAAWKAKNKGVFVISTTDGEHHDFDSFSILIESGVRLKPIIYCMLYCGMRIAEVLALNWDDVDFRRNRIRVRAAVKRYEIRNRVAGDGTPKYYFKIGPPKTKAANRYVPFGPALRECLLAWKQLQPVYAKAAADSNLVFPKSNGNLQDYDSFETIFRSFLVRIGLEPNNYHSRKFRHTYASYLVKDGVKAKTLQKLLGHTDIVTTLKYYVGTDEESMEEAASRMDNVVGQISTTFSFQNAV